MNRFAGHWIFLPPDKIFKLHVIELDDNHCIQSIFPLKNETSQTLFFNGILLLLNRKMILEHFLQALKEEIRNRRDLSILRFLEHSPLPAIGKDEPVFLYVLEGISFLTVKSDVLTPSDAIKVRLIC